jgi:YgiT-type zinc finger domain-containing protein
LRRSNVEQEVTYTLDMNGKVAIVEHVPAKVCKQCGERLHAPSTVERLQKTIWETVRQYGSS